MKKWVCSVCGYVHEGDQPPAECPTCKAAADKFNEKQEDFQKINGADFFLLKAEPWQEGDTVKFAELAGTLSQIKDFGREGFYGGIVADQIVKEMQK